MQPKDIVAAPTPDDPEAWTNFSLDSPESHPIFTPRSTLPLHPSSLTTTSDQLPELSTIPRPEELLKTPPYHLTVRQEGNMRVVVNASHGPSLVLLEGYLKRWCRGEVNRVNRVSGHLPPFPLSSNISLSPKPKFHILALFLVDRNIFRHG
jgi:hypothetical protein